MKIGDYVIILLILIFSSVFLVMNFIKNNDEDLTANIYYDGDIIYKIPLIDGQKGTIELKKTDFEYLLGDMVIEYVDKKIRVVKEESPQNICSIQGFTDSVMFPITCLPNRVLIKLTSETIESDDATVG